MAIRDPSEPPASSPRSSPAVTSKRIAIALAFAIVVVVLYDNATAAGGESTSRRHEVPLIVPPSGGKSGGGPSRVTPSEEDPSEPTLAVPVPAAQPVSAEGETPRTPNEKCDHLGVCRPFVLRSGSLFVQLQPDGEREPQLFRTGAAKRGSDGLPVFRFTPKVQHVVVDIGTNMDPDSITDFWSNESIGVLWFEPQKTLLTHPMHLQATRSVLGIDANRIVGLPAAVALENGFTKLYISATHGCTSLLPMNPKALEDSTVMKDSFKGGDRTFRDFSTSKVGFVNCIKKNSDREFDWVPTVKGSDVMRLIPKDVNVLYISVDAQGFDLHVAASFGKLARRADMIMLECQDLPHGHGMFLTQGAFSCAEVRHCIEAQLPHRMVAGGTGEVEDTCTINNPSEERNCMFRRMDRPYFNLNRLPYLVKRDKYKLRYGVRPNLECPSFNHE